MSILGGDVARAREELRVEAESLMVTACVLERKAGSTIDPSNGQRVEQWVAVPGGPVSCRVKSSREARDVVIGGQRVTIKPTVVCVRWDAAKAVLEDRFVTDRGVFHVVAVEHESWAIQQRYTCAENQEVTG